MKIEDGAVINGEGSSFPEMRGQEIKSAIWGIGFGHFTFQGLDLSKSQTHLSSSSVWLVSLLLHLCQGLADFPLRKDRYYFWLVGSRGLCLQHSTLLLQCKISHSQSVNKRMKMSSNNLLFITISQTTVTGPGSRWFRPILTHETHHCYPLYFSCRE